MFLHLSNQGWSSFLLRYHKVKWSMWGKLSYPILQIVCEIVLILKCLHSSSVREVGIRDHGWGRYRSPMRGAHSLLHWCYGPARDLICPIECEPKQHLSCSMCVTVIVFQPQLVKTVTTAIISFFHLHLSGRKGECAQRPEIGIRCPTQLFSTLALETFYYTEHGAWLMMPDWLPWSFRIYCLCLKSSIHASIYTWWLMWVLGIRTQIFMFAWQALSWLGLLSRPHLGLRNDLE